MTTESPIGRLRDFVERATQWKQGDTDRHAALELLDELDDVIEWIEKGIQEWRAEATSKSKQATAARATARVAIGHLQAVLNTARTHADQQRADTAARDWLQSIGGEPE